MRMLRLVPEKTDIQFIRLHRTSFVFSAFLVAAAIVFYLFLGLNFGIDFKGGTLIEVRTPGTANLSQMRADLSGLGLGEISLQEFGAPTDVLIRVEAQEGGERANQAAIVAVKDALGPGLDYRRTETVGPTVGAELKQAGIWAVLAALGGILLYIWFRFEWQFGICAVVALFHDVITTIGIFSVLGLEFNLATVAAILTIAGYSINDTVVVFDRVRENMRKFKKMRLSELLNRSVNDTLSRTVMTSVTTMLALLALFFFGGQVIREFTFAMIWGVIVGTYSSIFIAAPILLYMKVRRGAVTGEADEQQTSAAGGSS